MDDAFSLEFNQMMQGAYQPKTKVDLKFDFADRTKPFDDSIRAHADKFPSKLPNKPLFFYSARPHLAAPEQLENNHVPQAKEAPRRAGKRVAPPQSPSASKTTLITPTPRKSNVLARLSLTHATNIYCIITTCQEMI